MKPPRSFAAVPPSPISDKHLDNVKGVLFTLQPALPLLSKAGSIVIIGSTAQAGDRVRPDG